LPEFLKSNNYNIEIIKQLYKA